MQPEQPVQPQSIDQSTTQTAVPQPSALPARSRKRTAVALWLIIGPTALIVISIVLYAVANFMFAGTVDSSDSMFGQPNAAATTVNIVLFLIGAAAVASWLPALIIGIVLLATKKK